MKSKHIISIHVFIDYHGDKIEKNVISLHSYTLGQRA
jgi:hypothetical protein